MFKPGDKAVVVADPRGTVITVTAVNDDQISTSDGNVYAENELHQGHDSVLDTAEARVRDLFEDSIRAELDAEPRLDSELRVKLHNALESADFEVDLRGHWKSGTILYDLDDFKKGLTEFLMPRNVIAEDAVALVTAMNKSERLDRWINLGRAINASSECSHCVSGFFSLETDGKTIRLSGDECPNPEGFEPNEWELNVPSGKIVVANDLRGWFPLPEGDGEIESVNGVLGKRQTSMAYANIGMSHAFVGNTCPGVYSLPDGKFKIACPPADYWDKDKGEWLAHDPPFPFEGESIASICTDLWWYSLCDLDELERRAEANGGDMSSETVIDVKPGVYRFRHDDEMDRDAPGETLYATFEWVRNPDPVKDYLGDYQEVEVNPHAYVQAQVKTWPTLYGVTRGVNDTATAWADMTESQRHSSWKQVADHIFCTIGGGTDWHEKGFPTARVDADVLDIEPPSFRQQNSWYPFSKGYGGLFTKTTLSPSFAKLAFRVLESVISFGMNVNDSSHSREVSGVRNRMLLAVNRYRELAKEHPEEADADYVCWLEQDGRAEAWVKRFNLGPVYTQKHRDIAARQRWVPEDTYAVEFDARKLKDGHFAGKYGWASKKAATGFAIEEGHDGEGSCFWAPHAKRTAIPLYSVARVIKVGEVSHMGKTVVELAFDYGTKWMQNDGKRKAVNEEECKKALRLLTKEEYEALLPEAKAFSLA